MIRWPALTLIGLIALAPASSEAEHPAQAIVRLLEAWQLEDALVLAQDLLHGAPQDPGTLALAARVQFHRGEYASAVSLIRAASESGRPELLALRSQIETTAEFTLGFEILESAHFKIGYVGKDVIVATYLQDVLERAYSRIGDALGLRPAERGEKIAVELYPNARGLAAATGLTVSEIETSGTIAVAKFHRLMLTSPLATANGYGWADTVAHEFIHLIISKRSKNSIPIWLHEGIAKYYESLWRGKPGLALRPYAEGQLAKAVKSGELVTFAQMHPSMAKLPSQEMTSLAFAEVFTVIEFLREKHGARVIPEVLERAGEGVPLDRALHGAVGLGLEGLEKAWAKWLRTRPFRAHPGASPERIKLGDGQGEPASEKPLETLEDPDAQRFSRLGELLQLRGKSKAARIEYQKAFTRVGPRYPGLNYRLARAHHELGEPEAALRVLEASSNLHPADPDTHLLAGRIELGRKGCAEAEKHFEKVKMRNPYNPELHASMYQIHTALGRPALAAESQRFFELCRKPRSRITSALTERELGPEYITLVPSRWGDIRLDGGMPIAAPVANIVARPGPHTVEYRRKNGVLAVKNFELRAGEHGIIRLD